MKFYGLQFHPEVDQTKDDNEILKNFSKRICGCTEDYTSGDIINEIVQNTKKELGGGTAIIGVSGGVDSTTLATILAPHLGKQLKAFIIDTGSFRKGEIAEVVEVTKNIGLDLHVITGYEDLFIKQIGTTIDAALKREIFKKIYSEIYVKFAKEMGATHIIQGTLATDLIESGASGKSVKIKGHHNVIDWAALGVKEVRPMAELFKHEVRKLARQVGLGENISERQPFPGPGLFIRIVGVPVSKKLLDTVREADSIVTSILKKHGDYYKIAQTVVALQGLQSVGVMGDERAYKYQIAIRNVVTDDFMTTEPYFLDKEIIKEITSALSKLPDTVRVLFDYTPKPPATTEYE